MTAEDPTPTVRSRALAFGMSEERLAEHLERGTLRLDGEVMTDLETPAPSDTRIHIAASQ
ncbi:hypothetical protein [Pseudonocardia sp. C8]|uniref:hypothetical protein n=1 Tax=Pseudonocardia sp. C8 TaxID=2762759 RepID=UPI001C92BCF4|nr:hypothetical protein [Pseudonocardia sp. C8]